MKRYILLLLLSLVLPSGHSRAQTNDATLQRLTAWVQKVQSFDSEYTREKVYLHLDSNAYFVGETMWLKAYGIFLYNREDPFRFYTKRGVEKRTIQGFSVPRKFYAPQYNGLDTPTPDDCRRTLCWRPDVTTDAEGHASVVFFNSADSQRLRISVRGITPDGRIIEYDR